jgi:hypothetical protein
LTIILALLIGFGVISSSMVSQALNY